MHSLLFTNWWLLKLPRTYTYFRGHRLFFCHISTGEVGEGGELYGSEYVVIHTATHVAFRTTFSHQCVISEVILYHILRITIEITPWRGVLEALRVIELVKQFHILWKKKVHYSVDKYPPLVPGLRQTSPVYFNIIFPFSLRSFKQPLYFFSPPKTYIDVSRPPLSAICRTHFSFRMTKTLLTFM